MEDSRIAAIQRYSETVFLKIIFDYKTGSSGTRFLYIQN
ncbi:protein of unknown function [Oenococcus oeni]|uniref:Uncharacterized protein n=1 Tax=Oenococcus oeni TaxID=1247 RepID=A0AAQ2UUH7_OENOE|nr:hypothetical protein OENI_280006 [Oenococcus oeni]SYW11254.1 hypothetical protein OENI_60103 [Oenococcus oeni]VDB99307.1 protein of unknown function [Oenococcus oeni]